MERRLILVMVVLMIATVSAIVIVLAGALASSGVVGGAKCSDMMSSPRGEVVEMQHRGV